MINIRKDKCLYLAVPVTFFWITSSYRRIHTTTMKRSIAIRMLILVLLTSAGIALYAYSRSSRQQAAPCNDGESSSCELRQTQVEFLIWESLSHNLLGSNR